MNIRILPVGIFSALYLAISAPISVMRGNGEFLFYISIVIILAAIVMLIDRRVRFSAGVLWALSLWGSSTCLVVSYLYLSHGPSAASTTCFTVCG